jgi:hypothetical protein
LISANSGWSRESERNPYRDRNIELERSFATDWKFALTPNFGEIVL